LAAVRLRVEQRTGALARHNAGAIGRPDSQFGRTPVVQVRKTVGKLTVGVIFHGV